jgi:hypothetical protein
VAGTRVEARAVARRGAAMQGGGPGDRRARQASSLTSTLNRMASAWCDNWHGPGAGGVAPRSIGMVGLVAD